MPVSFFVLDLKPIYVITIIGPLWAKFWGSSVMIVFAMFIKRVRSRVAAQQNRL